jgi:RNA polymerase sigma-70 factor (ECF subfamily)
MAVVQGQVVPFPVAAGPLSSRGDDDLMLLCAAGQRAAFEALVERHLRSLCQFCGKFVGSVPIGEELAQEVLVELWARSPSYQPKGQFRGLLLRMARSRCLNQLRSQRRGERLTADPDPLGAVRPTIDDLLGQERQRRVQAALSALPVKLREAVLLRFDQELDYREIARVTGTFESTARSRVFHALKKLQKQVAEEDL